MMLASIAVAMGGRAAEEIAFGVATTGAGSDFILLRVLRAIWCAFLECLIK